MIFTLEFSDLTKLDFEILEFVKDNGPVSEKEIISHIHSDTDVTSLRIQELSKTSYDLNVPNHKGIRIPVPDSSYLDKEYRHYPDDDGMPRSEYTGFVSISRRGKKAIQDWKQNHSYKTWNNTVRSDLALAVAVLSLILSFYAAFSKTG